MVDKHASKRKFSSLGLLLITLAALMVVPGALAISDFAPVFNQKYETAGTRIDAASCTICHEGIPVLNDYGKALNESGVTPSSNNAELINGLTAIEQNDSDVDGFSNIVEINDSFFPGNASDHPTSDIIPPVTTSDVIENGSYNNSVTVTLNATDNGSGVNETIYMVNGGLNTTYSVPFVVDTVGPDNVTYWSTDKAGNVEPRNMVNFTIVNISEDIIPPVTTSDVTENGSYNNSVTVTLNATDNGSGVNETIYIVNGGPTTTYSAPFVVDTVGPDNVTYWSTDRAGNVEPRNMVNFTIVNISEDIIPPVTTSDVTENGSYNNSVTVTLNATDNGSGVNETIYIVNGGPTTTYSAPFVVDTVGPDNLTYWSTDKAGNVETQNMVNFTIVKISQVNATAIRKIENKSILPGESTIITVSIAGNANALALQEIPPEGWNITRGTDDGADDFKNSTNEWVWKNMEANKTVTYTLTAPENISIGTYQIEGTIRDANGILADVEGDKSVKIDILESYRRLGNDPGVVETGDLLRAFDDFRNNKAPQGFNRSLSAEEVVELVNEWRIS